MTDRTRSYLLSRVRVKDCQKCDRRPNCYYLPNHQDTYKTIQDIESNSPRILEINSQLIAQPDCKWCLECGSRLFENDKTDCGLYICRNCDKICLMVMNEQASADIFNVSPKNRDLSL